jgi:hypothetical protein
MKHYIGNVWAWLRGIPWLWTREPKLIEGPIVGKLWGWAVAVGWALVFGLLGASVARAQQQPLPGVPPWWQAVAYIESFKGLGLLPPWAGLEDDWRFVDSADSKRKVLCLRDRGTGARWTATGDLARWIAGAQGDLGILTALWETNASPRPAPLAVDVALCWPQPVARVPVTLGEPAYRAIVHVRPDRQAPLDWAAMGKLVMARPPAGQPCSAARIAEPTESADPLVTWRMAPGGGLTRCRG